MNIKDWTEQSFHSESKLKWPCPNCKNTSLVIVPENFKYQESAESKELRKWEFWDHEFIKYHFSGTLICKSCDESVSLNGYGKVEKEHHYDQLADNHYEDYYTIFFPVFFYPSPHIFNIPSKCPEILGKEILNSFSLFWFDLASCANKIRVSLEILLTIQKVKKTFVKNGKRKKLNLHQRIIIFKDKNEKVANFLLSIKWIGNTGSHYDKLNKVDILEAYELLEFSLNQLYDNKELKLDKISKEINLRKGKRRRKK